MKIRKNFCLDEKSIEELESVRSYLEDEQDYLDITTTDALAFCIKQGYKEICWRAEEMTRETN